MRSAIADWSDMILARPDQPSATAQRKPRILAQIVLAVYGCLVGAAALAQGIKYTVQIDAPSPLDTLLEQNLDLLRWRGDPRIDLEQLRHLAKVAPEQVKTLVATEGYYTPKVNAGLDTSGPAPVVRIAVDPGPQVTVGEVDIRLQGFATTGRGGAPGDQAALRDSWKLPRGAPFRTADWEAAKRDLLHQVMQYRFPRAQLADSRAVVDPELHRALLNVALDSGPEVHFDDLRIRGLMRYPRSVVTNLNPIKPGDVYSEAALLDFQARLQDTGYFSTVAVSADLRGMLDTELGNLNQDQQQDEQPDQPQDQPQAAAGAAPTVVPVVVRVTEAKQKNVALGLGFSTNTGARAQVNYDDLNVFGKRMKTHLIYEQRRQTARADFYWPTKPNGYNDSIGGGFERTNLESQITSVTSIQARRAWGTPRLERSLTLEALTEELTVDNFPTTRSKSLPLTFAITRRALDSLILPTRGYVASAQIGGALTPILTDRQFVRTYARFIYYHPVGVSGTLLLRAEVGAVASKDKVGVPSSLLFRAGGDQSVRGYGYQQLGVPEGDAIVGGRYLLTGSAEYDWWFKPPWGVALFYDVGNAADTWHELKPKVGYGVGARWRSPVGPINVDVAYGKAVKEVRLHFSLGFTF
jgi:translocation and assembly module TamA